MLQFNMHTDLNETVKSTIHISHWIKTKSNDFSHAIRFWNFCIQWCNETTLFQLRKFSMANILYFTDHLIFLYLVPSNFSELQVPAFQQLFHIKLQKRHDTHKVKGRREGNKKLCIALMLNRTPLFELYRNPLNWIGQDKNKLLERTKIIHQHYVKELVENIYAQT